VLTVVYALLWAALIAYGLGLLQRIRWAGWASTGVVAVAWGILTMLLIQRGYAAGHWPLANRYEFGLCFLWAQLAIQLLLEWSTQERRWGGFGVVIALLVATFLITRPAEQREVTRLTPALRSVWLPIHGLTAAMGYGACSAAAGLGLMQLVRPAAAGRGWPAAGWIDRATARSVGLSFPWLTLSILTGAIWAEAAWGRYWGWDPKETWSLVVWLAYLIFLHLRSLPRWRGRRLGAVAVAAFALLACGFVGLPWLVRLVRLETLHGF
jgi:ABC-type transport system involved in cytochrome c biogenesis permease subunit